VGKRFPGSIILKGERSTKRLILVIYYYYYVYLVKFKIFDFSMSEIYTLTFEMEQVHAELGRSQLSGFGGRHS
jgi:hypothetical protein